MVETVSASSEWLVTALILSGTLLVTAIAVVWAQKHLGKKIKALAAALGGEAVLHVLKTSYCRLDLSGKEGRIVLIPAGKYTPATLQLKIMQQPLFQFMIYKQGRMTKGFAKLGLVKDVQIGVPDFDDRYIIKAKDQVQTVNYFQNAEKRATVDELFRLGYETIRFDKTSLTADNAKYKKPDLEPERVRAAIAALDSLGN